jgi:hypothetical protein
MSSFDKLDAPTPAGTPSSVDDHPVKSNGSVKKAAAGDGKSSIAGAVFNLANAVRARSAGRGAGGAQRASRRILGGPSFHKS